MSGYAKFNEEMQDVPVPEESRERLQDECSSLGDEISRLGGTIDVLRDRLGFVLASDFPEEEKEGYATFGETRSDGSHIIREFRMRLDNQIRGIENIIQRLDL
jgi:hypothetical protein